jgi:hypothetical protein
VLDEPLVVVPIPENSRMVRPPDVAGPEEKSTETVHAPLASAVPFQTETLKLGVFAAPTDVHVLVPLSLLVTPLTVGVVPLETTLMTNIAFPSATFELNASV